MVITRRSITSPVDTTLSLSQNKKTLTIGLVVAVAEAANTAAEAAEKTAVIKTQKKLM